MESLPGERDEIIIGGRNNLIYLPFEDEGYLNIPMYFMRYRVFDPLLYIQNHRIVNLVDEFFRIYDWKEYKYFKDRSYPYTLIKPQEGLQVVLKLIKAANSDTVFEKIVDNNISLKLPTRELGNEIDARLEWITGNSCLMSPSHVSDFHLIDSLRKRGVNLSEVGIIVIDQHIDANPQLSKNGIFKLDKSNLLLPVLESGVGAISIMGIHERHVQRILDGKPLVFNPDDTRLPKSVKEGRDALNELQEFYRRYKDRVMLATGILGGERRMTHERKVLDSLRRQILFFKEKGVKQVLLSIDLDSLDLVREMITATPYSPFTSILLLGMQDFTQVLPNSKVSEISSSLKKLKKLKKNLHTRKQASRFLLQFFPIMYAIEEGLYALNYPTRNIQEYQGAHIITSDPGGFQLQEAEFIIKNLKHIVEANGLEIGVPVSNGKIMGSESELDGPDVNGNSSRAAIRMINAIIS